MITPTLSPAYGRDYRGKAAALADFSSGRDFILNDVSSRWDGKPTNKGDLIRSGISSVKIRYARLARVFVVVLS